MEVLQVLLLEIQEVDPLEIHREIHTEGIHTEGIHTEGIHTEGILMEIRLEILLQAPGGAE